jgi:putrescine aminotransferase
MDGQALYDDVTTKYAKHLNPGLARLMGFAGFGVECIGEGCYIFDQDGRKFLDCLGGYGTFALGHRHPKVVQAVRDQLDRITLSGKAFFSGPSADLAELLAEDAPKGLEFSFFCNSGTEAVEAALKFAKGATGRPGIVSALGSYHGKTLGALSVTGREKYRKMIEPLLPGVKFVPYGDAEAAAAAIDETVACMIVEPIQGEGGIILPPAGYLKEIRSACDRTGTLLILDEVQTGMARTGTMWGCDFDGVAPDLMPIAKALGGGVMPLGAMMGTAAVWEKVYGANPLVHTSTFGGNPLACAAGIAAVQVIREEGLAERSAKMGERLLQGLKEVGDTHSDIIQEVRGRGLMVGLEFREDEVGELVVSQLLKRGVCVAYALNNPRVLRFEPPLIIDKLQIEFAVEMVDCAIAETKEILGELH